MRQRSPYPAGTTAPVPEVTPALQKSKPADGFFSWTVVESLGDPPELPELGAVGVCDDRDRAMDELSDALRASPSGAFGLLHKVALNSHLTGYRYDDLITRAYVDPDSGAVVASERRLRVRGAPSDDVFTEVARAAGTA